MLTLTTVAPIIAPILDATLVMTPSGFRDRDTLTAIEIPGEPDGAPGHEIAVWWTDEPYGEGKKAWTTKTQGLLTGFVWPKTSTFPQTYTTGASTTTLGSFAHFGGFKSLFCDCRHGPRGGIGQGCLLFKHRTHHGTRRRPFEFGCHERL